jgi:hypothetical protein
MLVIGRPNEKPSGKDDPPSTDATEVVVFDNPVGAPQVVTFLMAILSPKRTGIG